MPVSSVGAGTERRASLASFATALRQEAHVLAFHAGLTWQQMHNRLQWAAEPVGTLLAAERHVRSRPGRLPWARTRTPFRESAHMIRTFTGHGRQVNACAVSPDGSWFVTGSADKTLKVWDIATGKERCMLVGHRHSVAGCAVSPDGSWIVSASHDGTLKVWDVSTGSEVHTLTTDAGWVNGCAVSPDGRWIVSASNYRTLTVWDVATGTELRTLTGHTSMVHGCAVSPDGSWILSVGPDETLRLWDVATGAQLRTLTGHTSTVHGCAVSPDGSWIVSSSADATLKVWDVATGAELHTLDGHQHAVVGCAVSPDGTWIVSASADATLKVWDVATGAELRTLTGHGDRVNSCAVTRDGTQIISASFDGTAKAWHATGTAERPFTSHTGSVNACAIDAEGSWVVTASADETLKVWDAANGAELRTLAGHATMFDETPVVRDPPAADDKGAGFQRITNPVNGCAVSPDGSWIVSASADTTLKLWNASTGEVLRTLAGHRGGVLGCAVSPDGSWIVSASADTTLKLWNASTGEVLHTLGGGAGSSGETETLAQWLKASTARSRAGHNDVVEACAVSPDGSWIVSASARTLTVWDAANGAELHTFAGHRKGVLGCAVSPDGTWIVSASADATLKVWDAATAAEQYTLEGAPRRCQRMCSEPRWLVDRLRRPRPDAEGVGHGKRTRNLDLAVAGPRPVRGNAPLPTSRRMRRHWRRSLPHRCCGTRVSPRRRRQSVETYAVMSIPNQGHVEHAVASLEEAHNLISPQALSHLEQQVEPMLRALRERAD